MINHSIGCVNNPNDRILSFNLTLSFWHTLMIGIKILLMLVTHGITFPL